MYSLTDNNYIEHLNSNDLNQMVEQNTICAISTAPGIGGVAVVRISGSDSIKIVDSIYDGSLANLTPMSMKLGQIMDGDHMIDEVLVCKFIAPHSYTGEDVVEIHCHGSIYVQSEIMRLLTSNGARTALNGEFTKRSFLNGKMDLSQAEAVADLIASESKAAHKLAIQQMKGGYSQELSELRKRLMEFTALLELELDFSEEDVEFADRKEFLDLLDRLLIKINSLVDSFRQGNVIKNGVPVAIIGAPNSGKSTLLNALLNEERAIVSSIPGTTRDAIEDTIVIDGITFRFIDTAGIRATQNVIENRGIEIAKKKAEGAHIVLKIIDAKEATAGEEQKLFSTYFSDLGWKDDDRTMVIWNKIDLIDTTESVPKEILKMSALKKEGVEELKHQLLKKVAISSDLQSDIVISNARHHEVLLRAFDALKEVQSGMKNGMSGDLLSPDINRALHYLERLLAK